jgi:hypothetical protein
MTIPTLLVSKHRPPIFKDFPTKNILFKIASPKNGKFIDWDFTLMILGDAIGVFIAFFFNMRIFVVLSYKRQLLIIYVIYTYFTVWWLW